MLCVCLSGSHLAYACLPCLSVSCLRFVHLSVCTGMDNQEHLQHFNLLVHIRHCVWSTWRCAILVNLEMCYVGQRPTVSCLSERKPLSAELQHQTYHCCGPPASKAMFCRLRRTCGSVCRQIRRPNQAVPVRFKVGDVIRHRRYHYRGVIYGWDAECKAEEDWMQQMRIDQLPGMPLRQF